MTTYRELTRRGVPNRAAAVLMGVPRSTATRVPRTPSAGLALVPANKLDVMERARIMAVVNSARFVDLPPIQIYAQLLDEGVYLGSISTIYRVLAENKQVKERRQLAQLPARAILRTGRHGSGAGLYVGHHKIGWPDQGQVLRLLRDDRYFLPLHRWSEGPSGRVRGPGRGDDGRDVRHSRHPAGRAR